MKVDKYTGLIALGDGNTGGGNTGGGGSTPAPSGGAFDLVKVTEYTPYSAAYSGVMGVTVSGLTTIEDEDYSVCNGTYNVTPETTRETDWKKRIYKLENSDYIFSYYTDGYDAYWGIYDSNENEVFRYYTTEDIPNGTNQWENYDWGYAADITTVPITGSVPEIQMALKGQKAESYDNDTMQWTFNPAVSDFSGFEFEPKKGQLFSMNNQKLVGDTLGFDPADLKQSAVFYCSNSSIQTHAESGQPLTCVDGYYSTPRPYTPVVGVKDGIPCLGIGNKKDFNRVQITAPLEREFTYHLCSDCTAVGTVFCSYSGNKHDGYSIRFDSPVAVSASEGWKAYEHRQWGLLCNGSTGTVIRHGDRDDVFEADLKGIISPNRWMQFVTVMRNGNPELWVNGVKVQQCTANAHYTRTQEMKYVLMDMSYANSYSVDYWSWLSECYLFDRSLSPAEIKYIWADFEKRIVKD